MNTLQMNFTKLYGLNPTQKDTSNIAKSTVKSSKCLKPRRNKSAFILFSVDMRPKLKGEDSDEVNSNQMMVKLAELWKQLPTEEKTRYDLIAREDKLRYLKELDDYSQVFPDECFNNKTKKNHVKKATSAFGFFLKDRKDSVKERFPDYKMADVLKVVSQDWKAMSEAEKKVFQDRAEVEKVLIKDKITKIQIDAKETNKYINPEAQLKKRKKRLLEGIKGKPEEIEVQMSFERMIDERIQELSKCDTSLVLRDKLAYESTAQYPRSEGHSSFDAISPSLTIKPFDGVKSPIECKTEVKVEQIEAKTESSLEEIMVKKQIKIEENSQLNIQKSNPMNMGNWTPFNGAKQMKNISIESNYTARTQASINSINSIIQDNSQSRLQAQAFAPINAFFQETLMRKQNNRKYDDLIANLLASPAIKGSEIIPEAPTLNHAYGHSKSISLLNRSFGSFDASNKSNYSDVARIQAIPQNIRSQIMNDAIVNALEITAEAQKTQLSRMPSKSISYALSNSNSIFDDLRSEPSRMQDSTQMKRTNINETIINALGGLGSLSNLEGLFR